MSKYRAVGTFNSFDVDEPTIQCHLCLDDVDTFYVHNDGNEYHWSDRVCENWECWTLNASECFDTDDEDACEDLQAHMNEFVIKVK